MTSRICSALRYWISQADALVRKVVFNVVATMAKRLAHFQVNSPRELSLARTFAWKFPCRVTLKNCSFYIIRLILTVHCILYFQREVLIELFTRGLINNWKNHFFIREIDTGRGKKLIFPLSRFLNRPGQTIASCKFFAKCSCGDSVGLSYGSHGAETRIKVDGTKPRVVIIHTRRDAVKRRVCPSIK